MITLHRIEAENIRALGHAVFEPLHDGLTAVNGPNGAGKSSLLTALLWAIYGVTPDGVVQQAMRRQGTEGTCRVIVEFEFAGQTVTVERGLKGRNDTAYMLVHVNGTEQAKTPSTGTKYLINLLGGLDAEGFLTAFVIRQKELDGLVKAKPSERRKLIERLAGIDRMSAALKSAREEETEVKKRLELLPGDPEAVQAARTALDEAQQHATSLWDTYEAAQEAEQSATERAEQTKTAAEDMERRVAVHTEAERQVTAAGHHLSLSEQALTTAARDLASTRAAAEGGSPEDVQRAQQAHAAATEAVQQNRQAREVADRAVERERADTERAHQMAQRATTAARAADEARNRARTAAERAQSFPNDLATQIEEAEQAQAEASERRGALKGEYDRVNASIRAMEATTDTCCPTCTTVLGDPTQVLASLRETLTRVTGEGTEMKSQVEAQEQALRDLRARAQAATQAANEASNLAAQAATQESVSTEAERDRQEAAALAQEAAEAAATAKAEAMEAAQQTHPLEQRQAQAADRLRETQIAAAAAARLPDLTAAQQEAEAAVAQARQVLESAQATERQARVDGQDRTEVLTAHDNASRAAAQAARATAETHGNFRVAAEQVKAAEKERDTQETRMRARAEAYNLLEQKTATREALDHFRKDRIASLAPELSEIATDHITKMTDGAFVSVELDEDFTPVVTDAHGKSRPSTWLSGGEESAVALALRLAIGEVIAGQAGGLLWMDEPQTAMDAQRRPAMMSAIRELPGRQPIIISHVTEATDMVDCVLEVVPDTTDGSTVVVSAVSGGVDESMLDALNDVA